MKPRHKFMLIKNKQKMKRNKHTQGMCTNKINWTKSMVKEVFLTKLLISYLVLSLKR